MELRTAQKLFLEKAEESRKQGHNKGILIFATGLGKTLASLSDALNVAGKKGKILVLAHNHNLLHQHAKDFKLLNKDKKIGYLYSTKKDVGAKVLFANIMTLKQEKYFKSFKPEEFDYIIIDETHHAGAKSYKIIFDYFKPKFFLGMTATPNRTDQIDILPLYDNNVLMQVETYEAINKGWLRKYKYVFLWDKWCDYSKVKSYRSPKNKGFHKYDVKELGKAYFVPERDKAIIEEFKKRAGGRRGIGFCVSVDESIRMAKLFNDNGIKSVAVWGGSTKGRTMNTPKRDKILEDFKKGKYQMLFNCEIIGEGLHFPSVDVVLKLRPTQSSIKDNQHNGRGLYNVEGLKINGNGYEKLLIIDWVGNYNKAHSNYIYQGKLRTNKNTKGVKDIREIIEMPIGCEVEFEEKVIEEFNKQISHRYNHKEEISKEDLIKEYNRVKKLLKKVPSHRDLGRHSRYSHHPYCKHFGSWPEFLKQMGDSRELSKEDLIKEYNRVKKLLKKVPTFKSLRKHSRYPPCRYCKHFGSWSGFIKQMGDSREILKEDLIKSYNRVKKLLKKVPTSKDMRKHSRYSFHLYCKHYCKHFGSWSGFIKQMGDSFDISKEDLIKNYNSVKKLLKKVPTCKDFRKNSRYPPCRYYKHFGSWSGFIKQVGDYEGWKKRRKERRSKASLLVWEQRKINSNIKITPDYKPKTVIIPTKIEKKGMSKEYKGFVKKAYKSKEDKTDIREKIISKIQDEDNVLLLESPDLLALKEIEKQNKTPKKIFIPNHIQFKELKKSLEKYNTKLNIELINTSALQYLADSEEKFDFMWLDYCGAFSYYMKDLDVLFAKKLNNVKLILTYNLFDPAKDDENYYFTRVIDYVLGKSKGKVRLINDISYRYKKQMYNLGFKIQEIKNENNRKNFEED